MSRGDRTRIEGFVAECFWPGVTEPDVEALDVRIRATTGGEEGVHYLGSVLMRGDEVVLCLFDGPADAVRDAAERAEVPFERIVEAAHSPWPAVEGTG
jgi:hypothetical protein